MSLAQALAPTGWQQCWSKTHNRAYYFHAATGKQTWDVPRLHPDPTSSPAAPAPAPAFAPDNPVSALLAKANETPEAAKRKRIADVSAGKRGQFEADTTDTDLVRAHYNAALRRDSSAREPAVTTLRKLNNFLKAAVIEVNSPYAPWLQNLGSFDVCDVACGKGGDIAKWARAGAHALVGFDLAELSIADAKTRAKTALSTQQQGGSTVFASCPPRTSFFCADMTRDNLLAILNAQKTPPVPCLFDMVSIQFALHYAFVTASAAHTAMLNVFNLLKPGGACIAVFPDANELVRRFASTSYEPIVIRADTRDKDNNIVCCVTPAPSLRADLQRDESFGLRYKFALSGCIDDCDEFLVCSRSLASVCSKVGLRVADSINATQFLCERGAPGFASASSASSALSASASSAPSLQFQQGMWDRTFAEMWSTFGLFSHPPTESDRAITSLYRVVRIERVMDPPAFVLESLLCRSAADTSIIEAACAGSCACHHASVAVPIPSPVKEDADAAAAAFRAYRATQDELQRKMEARAAHFDALEKRQQPVSTPPQTQGQGQGHAARALLHHAVRQSRNKNTN
jgi:mRNA (guanine-N7-)-methyltransferase